MAQYSSDHLIKAMRTTAVAIVVLAIGYKVLDTIAMRRVEREVARQQAEAERARITGDSSQLRPTTLDLIDGSTPGAGAASAQNDGDCQHAAWETPHGDPAALVREYVQRDGSGQFLDESQWRVSAVACPEQLADAGQATLISAYDVRPIARGADTTLVEVTYRRAGMLVQQGGEDEEVSSIAFVEEPRVEVDTFVVVRDGVTWRISAPMLEQHLLPDAALRHYALAPADRQKVEAVRK